RPPRCGGRWGGPRPGRPRRRRRTRGAAGARRGRDRRRTGTSWLAPLVWCAFVALVCARGWLIPLQGSGLLRRWGPPLRRLGCCRFDQVLGEPLRGRLARLVGALPPAPRIHGVVTALDFEQALGFAGPGESCTDQLGRADRVVLGEDHEQRTRRDQFDRPRGRVLKDRLERTHGDLVAPRWRGCLVGEIPALLIGLQRETLAGLSDVGDGDLAALDCVPDAFLDRHLLERGELFRTQGGEGDL